MTTWYCSPRVKTDRPFPTLSVIATPYCFRLGAPSYVYPADILPNVKALAPCMDDIEIVLYESGSAHSLPSPATIVRLQKLAAAHDLTYTVHFPIDRKLGSPNRSERLAHQKQIIKIIELTRPLSPFAYILHLDGIEPAANLAGIQAWQDTISPLLPAIADQAEDPARICLENLAYPFAWCEPFLERFGFSVCLDIGHLELCGGNVDRHFKHYAERIRVIHLHGVKVGKDHQPLTVMPEARLDRLLNSIDNFSGVLTLELFAFESVRLSLERLAKCLARSGQSPN